MARQDPIALAATLPCWGGCVSPVPLAGGLTNDNFLVEDGGERYVVRLGGDIPAHNIVRSTEAAASRAAHAAGVSPRVHYADSNALVIGFVEGRTLKPEDVRAPENHARLVDLIKRAHREIPKHFPGPAPLFWVFQVVRHYDRTLRELRSPHVSALTAFARMAERLEQAVGPIDIVFGHNDMLAANLLDDGERLWLVDWEYAGFNSPLFDLGGLASNSEASREAAEHMMELYFERPIDHDLRRRMAAMTGASLLRETLWSMVSEETSAIGFDYRSYTSENLRRFQRTPGGSRGLPGGAEGIRTDGHRGFPAANRGISPATLKGYERQTRLRKAT
jgi:thiamine kinase-like enzyme